MLDHLISSKFVNLYGMWLVYGKEEHKQGQTHSQERLLQPYLRPVLVLPARLSLELNLAFLSKKKDFIFFR